MSNNNVKDSFIGPIVGFDKSPDSKTGFQISMYRKGKEEKFDATEETYNVQFSSDYFPYPCLGEVLFKAELDQDGVITKLIDCTHVFEPDNPITSCYVLGLYKMFEIQINEKTPKARDVLSVNNNLVTFTDDYDKLNSEGKVCVSINTGKIPAAASGASFKIAPDINVYTWDWSSSLRPFAKCTREEAIERKFVTRFSLGSLEDISKDCYWVGFYSTRGNEEVCDLVKCFLNKAPGWE